MIVLLVIECPHFTKLPVRAGSACPNASTNKAVDVFGRAAPAPTGIFIYLAFSVTPDLQLRVVGRFDKGGETVQLCVTDW